MVIQPDHHAMHSVYSVYLFCQIPIALWEPRQSELSLNTFRCLANKQGASKVLEEGLILTNMTGHYACDLVQVRQYLQTRV